MKIENSELKKALFGALRTCEKDGILKMYRFTEKQVDYFAENESYIKKFKKSSASSCMNIDFYTDSELLKMKMFGTRASGQNYCYVDVYVDNVMSGHFGYEEKANHEFDFSMDLKPGKKRVTVYLSCLFGVDISSFELSDNAAFESASKDRKFMFFGDSITQGYITEFPSLSYANVCSRHFNAGCINQGIGAGVFEADDLDENIPYKPDSVFVAYGTNDWFHDRDMDIHAKRYCEKICSIFPDSKIYAILPIWRMNMAEKEKQTQTKFFDFRDNLKSIYEQFERVTIIDGFDMVPHYAHFFCEDGTHPNTLGCVCYGDKLAEKIKELEK